MNSRQDYEDQQRERAIEATVNLTAAVKDVRKVLKRIAKAQDAMAKAAAVDFEPGEDD